MLVFRPLGASGFKSDEAIVSVKESAHDQPVWSIWDRLPYRQLGDASQTSEASR
jgi:hypothetical protein